MTTTIWFLFVSCIILVVMIAYRRYELRTGRLLISLERRQRIDAFMVRIIARCISFCTRITAGVRGWGVRMWHRVHDILHVAWQKISSKVDMYFEELRGRRNSGKRGAVSLYWQQIKKETGEQ